MLKEHTKLDVERAVGSWLIGHRDRADKRLIWSYREMEKKRRSLNQSTEEELS